MMLEKMSKVLLIDFQLLFLKKAVLMVAEDCEGGEHERNADGAGTPEWKE